jgi:hypothetical protein
MVCLFLPRRTNSDLRMHRRYLLLITVALALAGSSGGTSAAEKR